MLSKEKVWNFYISINASLQLHFGCYVIRANKLCTLLFNYFEQLFLFVKQCRKKTDKQAASGPLTIIKFILDTAA